MAHVEEKKYDARIYVVSGLFFFCILAGGACLALYIILPETTITIWFAIFGMLLVGIPWAFWFLICMYRCCTYPVPANERRLSSKKNAAQAQAVATTTSGGGTSTGTSVNSPVDSPGGGRHVRFGAATVVGRQDSNDEDTNGDVDQTDSDNSDDRQEGSGRTDTSLNKGGSLTSSESEQPLTFSMSS